MSTKIRGLIKAEAFDSSVLALYLPSILRSRVGFGGWLRMAAHCLPSALIKKQQFCFHSPQMLCQAPAEPHGHHPPPRPKVLRLPIPSSCHPSGMPAQLWPRTSPNQGTVLNREHVWSCWSSTLIHRFMLTSMIHGTTHLLQGI